MGYYDKMGAQRYEKLMETWLDDGMHKSDKADRIAYLLNSWKPENK